MKKNKLETPLNYYEIYSIKIDPELEQLEDAMMDEIMAEDQNSIQKKQKIYQDLGLDVSHGK